MVSGVEQRLGNAWRSSMAGGDGDGGNLVLWATKYDESANPRPRVFMPASEGGGLTQINPIRDAKFSKGISVDAVTAGLTRSF